MKTFALLALLFVASSTGAMETLTFSHKLFPTAQPQLIKATGRVVIEDSLGNRFFETDDGARYLIAAENVRSARSDDRPFQPVDADQLGERLVEQLGAGFRAHTTKNYAIAYSTSREYAEWVSSLLERLNKALVLYWKKEGIALEKPEFPLPVIVYRTKTEYAAACKIDGVDSGAIGYYHMGTNVVRMYDLTGSDQLRATGARMRRGSRAEITRMLSTPVAEPLVATVVHEATHQVCYNTGLMQRMADLPLWYVEGMAVYFEAPSTSSGRGWRGIGRVNEGRLRTFRTHLREWDRATIRRLIATDDWLRDPRTAGVAYANSWALNYYLIKKRPKDFVKYVEEMAHRTPYDPAPKSEKAAVQQRLDDFEKHFGPIEEVQVDLLEAMGRL